jgi:hypothetical protein
MTLVRCVVIATGLGVALGCSSSQPVGEVPPAYTLLQDVDSLLRSSGGAAGRPPARVADMDRYRSMYPRGYAAVKSGDVVVLWGTALKGEGDAGKDEVVVAYEKSAPSDGGHVLLSAGTVKKMTAAEFNEAPKAKK